MGPESLGPRNSRPVMFDETGVRLELGLLDPGHVGCVLRASQRWTPIQGTSAIGVLSAMGKTPGFGGLLGMSPPWAAPGTGNHWPFPGQGPDLPLPLSLSHCPSLPPTRPHSVTCTPLPMHTSTCAHMSLWCSEGKGQVVERQGEPKCNFISVALSSCHSKSILLVTL